MEYKDIGYAVDSSVATVSLNRPEARNGYTTLMARELAHAFDRADQDDSVRVVVFTGQGDHFCSGLDVSSEESLLDLQDQEEAADAGEWSEPAGECAIRIFTMNKPVIAAISGVAIGAGATITLPADFRLAATDARFGFVFSRRGLFPEGASAWFLPRLVGMGAALDWMITGRIVPAEEALQAGLVHSIHEPEALLDKAYQLADAIASKTSAVSVAVTRQMLYRMSAMDSPLPLHLLDSRLAARSITNPDAIEGFMSLLEGREPKFSNAVSEQLPPFLPWIASERGADE